MITVTEHPTRPGVAVLRQQVYTGGNIAAVDKTLIWPIPVRLQTADGVRLVLMEGEELEIEYKDFIKLNVGTMTRLRIE